MVCPFLESTAHLVEEAVALVDVRRIRTRRLVCSCTNSGCSLTASFDMVVGLFMAQSSSSPFQAGLVLANRRLRHFYFHEKRDGSGMRATSQCMFGK